MSRILAALRAAWNRAEMRALGPVRYYRRRGARIGRCPIFSHPSLSEPHLCEFGDNVWVTPRVAFINHDGAIAMLYRAGRTTAVNVVGKITVRDNVFIGSGSIILGGVTIGPNAIVAAGSLVTRDVAPETVVGGCPAQPICSVDEYLAKYASEEQTLWVEQEPDIRAAVIDFFMQQGNSGKRAIRLRRGDTPLIR